LGLRLIANGGGQAAAAGHMWIQQDMEKCVVPPTDKIILFANSEINLPLYAIIICFVIFLQCCANVVHNMVIERSNFLVRLSQQRDKEKQDAIN
jgi:hypothetical protein